LISYGPDSIDPFQRAAGYVALTPLSVPIELTSPAFSGAFFEHVLNDAAHG
jgi:hypothetical protein